MEAVHYLLAKFPKTVINLTRVGPWEAGSIVKTIVKAFYPYTLS